MSKPRHTSFELKKGHEWFPGKIYIHNLLLCSAKWSENYSFRVCSISCIFCKVSSLFTFHIYSANFSVRRDFNNLIVRSKIPWKNKCVVTPQMPRRRTTFQMSNLVQQFFYCRIGYTSLKITNCFKFQRTNSVKILYDWNQIEIWTGIL